MGKSIWYKISNEEIRSTANPLGTIDRARKTLSKNGSNKMDTCSHDVGSVNMEEKGRLRIRWAGMFTAGACIQWSKAAKNRK